MRTASISRRHPKCIRIKAKLGGPCTAMAARISRTGVGRPVRLLQPKFTAFTGSARSRQQSRLLRLRDGRGPRAPRTRRCCWRLRNSRRSIEGRRSRRWCARPAIAVGPALSPESFETLVALRMSFQPHVHRVSCFIRSSSTADAAIVFSFFHTLALRPDISL